MLYSLRPGDISYYLTRFSTGSLEEKIEVFGILVDDLELRMRNGKHRKIEPIPIMTDRDLEELIHRKGQLDLMA